MSIRPILFNTETVRAILDGRKTCTRRVIKFPVNRYTNNVPLADKVVVQELRCDKVNFLEEPFFSYGMNLPYQPGDILYARETWQYLYELDGNEQVIEDTGKYYYAATDTIPFNTYVDENGVRHDHAPWRPSIHMPKEAARIWLKVTDVRVERLQEITEVQAQAEGIRGYSKDGNLYKYAVTDDWWIDFHNKHRKSFLGTWWQDMPRTSKDAFSYLWNSTIKKSDLDRYGWDVNPWVWVIEFERCDKQGSER